MQLWVILPVGQDANAVVSQILSLGHPVKAMSNDGRHLSVSATSTIVAVSLDGVSGNETNTKKVMDAVDAGLIARRIQHHGIIVRGESWVTWRPGNLPPSPIRATPTETTAVEPPETAPPQTFFDHLTTKD